jgi:D-amino peptidase
MKILISVDMEGVSGVVLGDHVRSSHKEYERFRKLMTAEANAAIQGALAGGAQEIVVNDSHGRMANVLIEELDPAAELISGSPKPHYMMQGIGSDVDGVFLVGYHAASGTGSAILEHTSRGHLVEVLLNGQPVGEMGLNAAVAGSYDVPVLLVTGDRAVTEEATALLGDVETVSVKEGVSRSAARCLHPEVARQMIREAAQRALSLSVSPFVVVPPITLRIVFLRAVHADMAELVPGCRRVDGRTVEWRDEDMFAVYKAFRAMTILAATA